MAYGICFGLDGPTSRSLQVGKVLQIAMRERLAVTLVTLMLTTTLSSLIVSSEFIDYIPESDQDDDLLGELVILDDTYVFREPWVEPTLLLSASESHESLRVTVITYSILELAIWQENNGQSESQAPAVNNQKLESTNPSHNKIDHRTFWLDPEFLDKLSSVPGVIGILDAKNSPEPYDITPLEDSKKSPLTVRSGEVHGAIDAWERGYSGEGIVVAVADTGVDFSHPDLEGTQARILDGGPYHGWPMMFDHNSMYYWLADGESYPSKNTWYADTSTLDWDNDSDGLLDISGLNISGIPQSQSGVYHLGEHPDSTLRSQMGGDVPIIVVDTISSGIYDMVIPDVNRNDDFSDDENMTLGNETAGLDEDQDGIRDVSAGLLYWISDGMNGVPYGETYAARHGYSDRIAGSGNLTLFMLDSGSHGTLCASAIAAQAQVDDGSVLGMSPNATIASIGNHYSGGHSLDGWRWIAEGVDGNKESWNDQPHIGSFSFGYSSIDDSGADSYSLYLDWLTRVYNNQTHYAVAIGNGGHGYGTVKVPGAAQGIFSVGAFSSRTNDLWGQSAPWNNRGPNIVGRMDPDIVAVGWSASGDIPLNLRDNGNSATTTWGGTSLATPITAGLLALVEEAWLEKKGVYPDSQEFRDFILSTADDRGYDPFVQGGGWLNASRATATIDGHSGSWSVSPSQWNSGTFEGQHRDANINVLNKGESQQFELEFTNTGDTDLILELEPTTHEPLKHVVGQWLSIGNGSDEGANDTWDGYQSSRPDLLIPIHVVNNTTFQLPNETVLVRARAVIEYAAFDSDLDRSSDERIEIKLYRWSDDDGDGLWAIDEDNDSMIDEVDWTESSEFDEYAEWYMHGPQAELRVGLPFDDMEDGLFLGVSRRDVSSSGLPNVSIEWDWTAFGSNMDNWISTPRSISLPADSVTKAQFYVSVPLDADSGLHQHGISISTFELNSNGTMANHSHRDWTLPVVTNVPWVAPFDIDPLPLDGNVSNQTLYSESWISGAQRWNWRAESGDWRIMTVDWPESLSTGGAAFIEVDWDDNQWTDVDVMWLSQKSHGYTDEDPDAYGSSTFYIEERSVNNYRNSGRHDWGTYTGGSKEVLVVPASPGLHQLVLHTVNHGVSTNDNPLNISIGYVAAESSGFHRVVDDWSMGSGNDSVHLVSNMPLPLESVNSFGWTQPLYLPNETAYQDDPNDKMSASWWHNFSLQDVSELEVEIDCSEDADLDLYLFRDDDQNGVFESGEEIGNSRGGNSDESIIIVDPDDGNYSVAVLGWSVPGSVNFWMDLEIVGGDKLRVTNSTSLNSTEIGVLWPNGSTALNGEVPESAIELSIEIEMPSMEGIWQGYVDVNLENGVEMRMPFIYELVDLNPELNFITPDNLTQTNVALPISLHAKDIGSGFSLANLSWIGFNNTTLPPGDSGFSGVLWNLSAVEVPFSEFIERNGSRLFREIWVNTTLPENEQWYEYQASLSDISGRNANDWLSVKFDTTAPNMVVSNIPVITNDELLVVEIQTEWDAELRHNGEVVETSSTGNATIQINLDESQALNWNSPFMMPKSGYLVGGNNTFLFSVEDPAGNAFNRSFEVVLDTSKPEIFSSYFFSENSENRFENWSWSGPTLNVTDSSLSFEVTPDIQSMCLDLISNSDDFVIEKCKSESSVIVTQQNLGAVFTTELYKPFLLELGNLSDGEYYFEIELIDWANNSNQYTYPLVLDRTLPGIDWSISPVNENQLMDHRLGISWISDEDVHLQFSHNGEILQDWNSSYGGHFFDLQITGVHEFCIEAWDYTESQINANYIKECKSFILPSSLYSTQIWANWDGTVVGSDSISLMFQRGPDQWANITQISSNSEILTFEPGLSVIEVDLELEEGDNQFLLEINALDHVQSYTLYVTSDTIYPKLNITQIENRTTNLESSRLVNGSCEKGATVTLSTEISSISFICNSEELFSVTLGIPSTPGWHLINASTIDLGGNTNNTSIEVQFQNWFDWAIDDAQNGGPILYWTIIVSLLAIIVMISTQKFIGRKKTKKIDLEIKNKENEPPVVIGEKPQSKSNQAPLPEEEELQAWARGDRYVRSWEENLKDDDIIDLD